MTTQTFKDAVIAELKRRGYTDIEIIGSDAGLRRANAYVKTPSGACKRVRIICPENQTTYRRLHFRITEVE